VSHIKRMMENDLQRNLNQVRDTIAEWDRMRRERFSRRETGLFPAGAGKVFLT
jgi:hypothetical protein